MKEVFVALKALQKSLLDLSGHEMKFLLMLSVSFIAQHVRV